MGDELRRAAESCFRASALEHLGTEERFSVFDSYKLSTSSVHFDVSTLLDDLLRPSEASATLRPIMQNGRITGFVEEDRDLEEMGEATTSMSLTRTPFTATTSIKGSSSNVPFYPGGFGDALSSILLFSHKKEELSEQDELKFLEVADEEQMLCRPPGFINDVHFEEEETHPTDVGDPFSGGSLDDFASLSLHDMAQFLRGGIDLNGTDFAAEKKEQPAPIVECPLSEENTVSEEPALETLPPTPEKSKASEKQATFHVVPSGFTHAKELSTLGNIPEYQAIKSSMAREYPFPLDPFQQAAVLCMENGESLFVAAHTSAGKTVVAEYAVALCRQHRTKAIYTSPIKALSNQKFRDFKLIFDDVGLVTGDIQLHPEAFCLIMTTEILRSMLYNGSEVIRDLEWVVFDEVHYINNAERGHVWEEVLIMLPAHVKIVMLSATVPNCVEFADWVGRIKNRRINVISTLKRPVPLEHFLYTGQDGKTKKDLFKIVDAKGEWQPQGYRQAQEAKAWIKKNDQKGKQNGGGGGGLSRPPPGKNDKNVYISLVDHLRANDKLPMVVFVFSRKRCDDNAQLLSSMDLTTEMEKGHIKRFFNECVGRLKGSDKRLPQVLQMRELCLRGFAVHHSGILPILKEVVELLFQQGFVKILFATETFAMGVNMPARTVVFDAILKHDGTQQRLLNTGEYIQMAGRAGRRGLDSTGTVIVLAKGLYVPDAGELQTVMMGKAGRLESQFRVTYSMLLNLLRVEQLRIEDMLQRSYVESASLRDGLARKAKLDKATDRLAAIEPVVCQNCEPSFSRKPTLRDYHDVMIRYLNERSRLWPKMAAELKEVDKLLNSGRVLILNSALHQLENKLAVLIKEHHVDGKRSLEVLLPCTEDEATPEYMKKCVDGWNSISDEEKRWRAECYRLSGALKHGFEGAHPPITSKYVFRIVNVPITSLVAICAKSMKIDAAAIVNEGNLRALPRFRNYPVEPATMKVIAELNSMADNWSNSSQIKVPGVDFTISNVDMIIDVTTLTSLRERLLLPPDEYPCLRCFDFQAHMEQHRSRVRMEREIHSLQYQLSSDALLLSEEYQNRLKVLKALDYVKEGDMVSFKGRVACEIHHQELLITELILENKLHDRTTAEVAAMLSATTCQYKSSQETRFEPGSIFYELKQSVEDVRNRLEIVAQKMRVSIVDVGDDIRFDLMEVVYHWADGMPFSEIMAKTDAQEGLIVRCIQRLGEVCKDVRNAARIVGDPALHEKMEQVSAAIKRDIVFAASLYTSL